MKSEEKLNQNSRIYIYLSPLTVLGLGGLSIYLFAFMHYQTDTDSYLNAAKIFLGLAAEEDVLHRTVKVANYFFPALLYYLGLPIKYGFFAQQWISYGCSAFFIYQFFKTLKFSRKQAYCAMFAYLSCQTVAIFNFALMTDGMGWMMELWGLWLASIFLKKLKDHKSVSILFCLSLGVVFGFGLLIKESVLMAGLYLFIGIIGSPTTFWQKIKLNFWVGLGFLAILLSFSYYTEIQFGKSMLSWWKFAHTDPPSSSNFLSSYLIQLARTLDLHWFWVILGGFAYLKEIKRLDFRIFSVLIAAVVGLIIFPLAWPYLTDRIIFMVPILLLPACLKGVEQLPKIGSVLLICGGFLNLGMTYMIYYHKIAGILFMMALGYGGVILLAFLYQYLFRKSNRLDPE